ncbi:hypothetical protein [Noviherbaspirillum humi]|uniref:hypothetical protein n=1 Tax=Noviherbaspirillum humi TaxID=1688639 RepID=UPI001160A4F7|nr:hypothetical protein [Noviherbaspirillum humi]
MTQILGKPPKMPSIRSRLCRSILQNSNKMALNVSQFPERRKKPQGSDSIAGGGGGPYDGEMEARLAKLEEFATDARERLVKIEARLDGMDEKMVTKADFQEGLNSQIKWIVGTAGVITAAGITVLTFVLNNAVPKSTPQVPQSPIVIQVPVVPQATPTVAPSITPQAPGK